MDYRSAGVDIQKGNQIVHWLKGRSSPHHKDRILSAVGGFASLFKGDFPQMKNPYLASAADGVGTKLKLAVQFSSFKGVGQDLVAMCINDLLCVGARPLFFLDYYACEQIKEKQVKEFLKGVELACEQSGCSLIGGETAEMPDFYKQDDFDCAGFAVGVVDKEDIIGAHRVKKGDRLLALASSGFHSNGYSLLRKVFEHDLDQWASELLKPTTIYADVFHKVLKNRIHALAHITGGGLDNVLRVVPKGSYIQLKPWSLPPHFVEVKKRARLSWMELLTTLNCGLGMVALVDSSSFDLLAKDVANFGMTAFDLGELTDISSVKESCWNLDYEQWNHL